MIGEVTERERVFKTAWFTKAARKAHVTDDELCKAIAQVMRGQAENLARWRFVMATKRRFKSEAFEAIHSSASALHKVGAIDQTTMRSFDVSCLASPQPLEPEQIKKLRMRLCVSQPVFARYLNTSESTVEKWETGAKRPSGTALKLLAIVDKHGLELLT